MIRHLLAVAAHNLLLRWWPPTYDFDLDLHHRDALSVYEENNEVLEASPSAAAAVGESPAGEGGGELLRTATPRRATPICCDLRQELTELLIDLQPWSCHMESWCAEHHTVYSACWVAHAVEEIMKVVDFQRP